MIIYLKRIPKNMYWMSKKSENDKITPEIPIRSKRNQNMCVNNNKKEKKKSYSVMSNFTPRKRSLGGQRETNFRIINDNSYCLLHIQNSTAKIHNFFLALRSSRYNRAYSTHSYFGFSKQVLTSRNLIGKYFWRESCRLLRK